MASEQHGGIGANPSDVFTILHAVGYYAAGIPLGDTMMANWLLSQAGIAPPQGHVCLMDPHAQTKLSSTGGNSFPEETFSALLSGVAWADNAQWGVTVSTAGGSSRVLLLELETGHNVIRKSGRNGAAEPFADLVLTNAKVKQAGPIAWINAHRAIRHLGAMSRSAQLVGALERVLELSVAYAVERVQFGKPIAKNQAIQHMLAVMAGQIASARAATIAAFGNGEPNGFDVAVAKLRTSEAAGISAATAHQVHGAIGFTHEHNLHFFTRRLWAWRKEFGTDNWWAGELRRSVIAAGPSAFWPTLVARRQPECTTLPLSREIHV
ncbi:acyl-CoA/acyl-ACP dehydrogenase [Polaromonas sp. P1-6]|nr:acyl-CoA/acyl-ACP dehydrogenase [Polaromonas sp. P1-6]